MTMYYTAHSPPPLTEQPFSKGRDAFFLTAAPTSFVCLSPEDTVQSCIRPPADSVFLGAKALTKSTDAY